MFVCQGEAGDDFEVGLVAAVAEAIGVGGLLEFGDEG